MSEPHDDAGRPVALVLIATQVAPGREAHYLAWANRVIAAEAEFEGFVGQHLERPIPGVQDEWVTTLAFDTKEHLDAWLASPQRAELIETGGEFGTARVTRGGTGFGFGMWSPAAQRDEPSRPESVFKSNLLVLLVLYPTVYLWGFAAGTPLFTNALDWPWWAVLFVGNIASTQLLGWWFVPWAMRLFAKWLEPKPGWRTQLVGYGAVIVLSAGFMALYAWMIAAIGHS